VSKLTDLHSRIRSLQDIKAILTAMKNLSLVEITKISRFYATQQELFQSIEFALADFEQFYGTSASPASPTKGLLCVLIGSERGFCGGFNEAIQKEIAREALAGVPVNLILVGRKLALKFLEDARVVASLDGPSAAEEIPSVISQLAKVLTGFPEWIWKIVHNRYTNQAELRPELFEQYLFALFYGIFYLSFMAENHERLRHMDGALNKIKEEEQRLLQLSNSLRQEAITEELEIIMLSVDGSFQRRSQ
jgi:F-type H+-transporting ATPase subunit gamma